MKFGGFFLILVLLIAWCPKAQADFRFYQEVHTVQSHLDRIRGRKQESDFKRKIYVLGQVFAIQIEENGKLKKEYGFDFSRDLYYEADPEAGYYKLFDLKVLGNAFEKISREAQRFRGSRQRITREITRALLEGKVDFPVRIRKALLGKKEFNGLKARLYKLREGPGTAFLNFFGWYRKANIWATADVPGFSEYTAVRSKLGEKAVFYKIKHNQASDLVTTLLVFRGIPLRIDSVAKRTFDGVTVKETTRESTSLMSTAKIKPDQLLYFKQSKRFSWNAVFSNGTEFGREVSVERGEDFDVKRSLAWFIVPALFFLITAVWFFGGYSEKDDFSLKKRLVLKAYVLTSFLFLSEIIHYLAEIPYWIAPWFELGLVAAAGLLGMVWKTCVDSKKIGRQMKEARLRYCPNCRARCEAFYVVCPKCNSPL